MPKTNKELAVELASAYLTGRFANPNTPKPLDGQTLVDLLKDAYQAVIELPDET